MFNFLKTTCLWCQKCHWWIALIDKFIVVNPWVSFLDMFPLSTIIIFLATPRPSPSKQKKNPTHLFSLFILNFACLNVFSSKPSHRCLFGMAAYQLWEKTGVSKQDNGVSVLWTKERMDFTVGNMSLKMSAVLEELTKNKPTCLWWHCTQFLYWRKKPGNHKINSLDSTNLGPTCWVILSESSL